MNKATVVIQDTDAVLESPVKIIAVTEVGLQGPRGPGILSNIIRITASDTPPVDPEVNDLWVDLS